MVHTEGGYSNESTNLMSAKFNKDVKNSPTKYILPVDLFN